MNASAQSASNRLRKAAALVVALLLAALAFGVGLPWIIVDAPPQAETLWAQEIQARTMPALKLAPMVAARSGAGRIAAR